MDHKRHLTPKLLPKDFRLNKAAKSLITVAPLTRSLSSGKRILHNRTRSKSNASDESSPSGSQTSPKSDHFNDNDNDCGKLKMGKSVISLLTTTSIYSEFKKLNKNNYTPNDNDFDDVNSEEEFKEDEEENEDTTDDAITEEPEETADNNIDSDSADYANSASKNSLNSDNSNSLNNLKSTLNTSKELPGSASDAHVYLSLFEQSVIKSLESKRQVICGVESSRIISSNRNIRTRAIAVCNKLKSTFQVDPNDELLDDYSCWLLRDVLLQGHLYITKNYLLFFAYLPSHHNSLKKKDIDSQAFEERIAMSGALSIKKHSITSKFHRYWCVLKGSSFSVYSDSTNLYFPLLTIDLRYVLRAEVVYENNVATSQSTLSRLTNLASHDPEFVGANDLGSSELMDNSHHRDDSSSFIDELKTRKSTLTTKEATKPHMIRILTETKTYLFYCDNLHSANEWVSCFKAQIFTLKNQDDKVTIKLPLTNLVDLEVNSIFENAENIRLKVLENSDSYALDDYFFLFFNSCLNAVKSINKALQLNKEKTQIKNHNQSVVENDYSNTESPNAISDNYIPSGSIEEAGNPIRTINDNGDEDSSNDDDLELQNPTTKEQGSLLKNNEPAPSNKQITGKAKATLQVLNPKHIVKNVFGQTLYNGFEMWSSNPTHYEEINSLERGSEDLFFVGSEEERVEAAERFRKHFSLPSSEKLIATYYAYLQRNIPLYGKIYLGSTKICFRSLLPRIHTKMILPFGDIENCYKEKNFSFGYSGLVTVINGHEELFFEFSANDSRDDCEYLLLKQLDFYKRNRKSGDSVERLDESVKLSSSVNNLSEAENIIKNEDKISLETGSQVPIIIKDYAFARPTFKPSQKFKITCLTIGSRGDVQPYIALCKGLLKEGHKPRIATHGEFREVVESHGIEFKEIAGSPTELMSFMGHHGSISVSFLKDAKSKFTGWIDELLTTSWEACQGSEILIESPSAMAGIHIAEALNIPYFRAFTMPWTRTRAYPHAFIVPELKKGGSYNYFTHVMFENVFWKGISSQVNKWRRSTLGLGRTDLYQLQQNKVPFLYNVSPTVFPPSVDFADWVKVTGYWFLDEKDSYKPPAELQQFIKDARAAKKKLIYIGFGSIVVSDPKELTAAVIEAVKKADVWCVLNKGWSNRLEGGDKELEIELPPQIYNAGSVPHDWLFNHVDAAVHHGGSGTTGASLRHGLPTIIKPFFGDQFFYAHRVEDMSVGIYLKKLNKDSLAKAIKEAVTSTRIIKKAKAVGIKIRLENGVQSAMQTIYSQLDYAQLLISSKREISHNVDVTSVRVSNMAKQQQQQQQPEPQLQTSSEDKEDEGEGEGEIGDIDDYINDSISNSLKLSGGSDTDNNYLADSLQASGEIVSQRRKSNGSWLLL